MQGLRFYTVALLALLISVAFTPDDTRIVSFVADPAKQQIQCLWKDEASKQFNSIANVMSWAETRKKELLFAMNGGMYMEDRSPLGLYIDNGIEKHRINRDSAYGNFYLKPNGIFFTVGTDKAYICKTEDFRKDKDILYATQSGPLLVIDGEIHPAFKEGSKNLQIQNGVGILPDGKVLFAISKTEINFYDFAKYFRDAGCKYALFLDGFVSRAYIPSKGWRQVDGNFGVIIGVTAPRQVGLQPAPHK
jgi:uncharacterized protein YigE (DUF2233 family)